MVVQQAPQPETHLIMSIFNLFCCSCILGLYALILSLQSDSAYKSGRLEEAESKGQCARKFNIAGIIIGIIEIVAAIVFVILWYVVFAGMFAAAYREQLRKGHY